MKICLPNKYHFPEPVRLSVLRVSIIILPMAVAALAAVSLGQSITWDTRNYHFYSGFAFLHKPLNYDFAPAQVQSFFNPLLSVLSYLMLEHLPSKLVAIILGSVQGFNFYLVFRISQALFAKWENPLRFRISLSCAATGCFGAAFITELGTTFGDNLTSILILAALLLLIRYLQSNADRKPVKDFIPLIAGALLGFALALKLTVAIYVVSLGIAFAAFILYSKRPIRHFLFFLGAMSVSFLIFYGYWGYNLFREYRNPVFPYMNAVFQSPFYDPVNVTDARFLPRTWEKTYFYPFFFAHKNTLVSENVMRDIRMALCYVAFFVLAAGTMIGLFKRFISGKNMPEERSKSPLLWFITTFVVISYIAWQVQFSIYRYIIVLELLAPVFLVLVLERFIGKRSLVFSLSLVLNLVICAWTVPANFGRGDFNDAYIEVEFPPIKDFRHCVILMGGSDPTAYIIPSAPVGTRFVRVASNFLRPGRNAELDDKIRDILDHYDRKHTFVYFADNSEKEQVSEQVGYYGVAVDEQNCAPVESIAAPGGSLCATLDPDIDSYAPTPVSLK